MTSGSLRARWNRKVKHQTPNTDHVSISQKAHSPVNDTHFKSDESNHSFDRQSVSAYACDTSWTKLIGCAAPHAMILRMFLRETFSASSVRSPISICFCFRKIEQLLLCHLCCSRGILASMSLMPQTNHLASKNRTTMERLLGFFWLCCLLATTEGSSKYRSRSLGATNYDPYYSITDDDHDDSSHFMSSSVDDEERILSALEQLEEIDEGISGLSYRPKARGVATHTLYELPPQPQPRRHQDRRYSGKRKTGKTKRRRKVAKGSQPEVRNDDELIREAASVATPVQPSSNAPLQSQGQSNITATVQSAATKPVHSAYSIPPKLAPPQQRLSPRIDSNGRTAPTPATAPVHTPAVSSTTPWVRRYLNARPKDVLLPVPKEYIADGFNLAQLAPIVERIGFQVLGAQAVDIAKRLVELPSPQPSYPIYRLALQLLLSENETQDAVILQHPLIPQEAIEQAAEALYLLVHARFITSPRGLDALRRILLNSPVFGKCPRIQCEGATLLPHGACNDYTCNTHACQRYCPSCGNLWNCWESKTDGCAWGPSLCYLLLLAHGHELYPTANRRRPPPLMSTAGMVHHPNDPSIFGFRIHPAATWGRPLTG